MKPSPIDEALAACAIADRALSEARSRADARGAQAAADEARRRLTVAVDAHWRSVATPERQPSPPPRRLASARSIAMGPFTVLRRSLAHQFAALGREQR